MMMVEYCAMANNLTAYKGVVSKLEYHMIMKPTEQIKHLPVKVFVYCSGINAVAEASKKVQNCEILRLDFEFSEETKI